MASLKSTAETARERAQQAWATFRAKSGFFQLRVLIVVFNVALIVATYIVFTPSPPLFKLDVRSTTVIFSERAVVDIESVGYGDAKNLKLVITGIDKDSGKPGKWRARIKTLPQGVPRRVQQKRFVDRSQRAFCPTLAPHRQS